jgi:hypothetical protein
MADDASNDETAEQSAADAAREGEPADDARRWLRDTPSATLCTLSARTELDGYPFGSIVPYALDASGRPVIFIAHIAAHTSNLRKDARASLFVHEPRKEDDPQTGWRLTVLGRMSRLMLDDDDGDPKGAPVERVSRDALEDIHARYKKVVPAVDRYDETHGFAFWRMSEIEKVRYIAGFGKICWIDGAELVS